MADLSSSTNRGDQPNYMRWIDGCIAIDYDPSVTATLGAKGQLAVQLGTTNVWQKQDNGTTTNWAAADFSGTISVLESGIPIGTNINFLNFIGAVVTIGPTGQANITVSPVGPTAAFTLPYYDSLGFVQASNENEIQFRFTQKIMGLSDGSGPFVGTLPVGYAGVMGTGKGNIILNTPVAIAIFGNLNTIQGSNVGVFGDSNTMSGSSGFIFGSTNTVNPASFVGVIGSNNNVSGNKTFVVGSGNTSPANQSFIFGDSNTIISEAVLPFRIGNGHSIGTTGDPAKFFDNYNMIHGAAVIVPNGLELSHIITNTALTLNDTNNAESYYKLFMINNGVSTFAGAGATRSFMNIGSSTFNAGSFVDTSVMVSEGSTYSGGVSISQLMGDSAVINSSGSLNRSVVYGSSFTTSGIIRSMVAAGNFLTINGTTTAALLLHRSGGITYGTIDSSIVMSSTTSNRVYPALAQNILLGNTSFTNTTTSISQVLMLGNQTNSVTSGVFGQMAVFGPTNAFSNANYTNAGIFGGSNFFNSVGGFSNIGIFGSGNTFGGSLNNTAILAGGGMVTNGISKAIVIGTSSTISGQISQSLYMGLNSTVSSMSQAFVAVFASGASIIGDVANSFVAGANFSGAKSYGSINESVILGNATQSFNFNSCLVLGTQMTQNTGYALIAVQNIVNNMNGNSFVAVGNNINWNALRGAAIGQNLTNGGAAGINSFNGVFLLGDTLTSTDNDQMIVGNSYGIGGGNEGQLAFGVGSTTATDSGRALSVDKDGLIRGLSGGRRSKVRVDAGATVTVNSRLDYNVISTASNSTINLPAGVDGMVYKINARNAATINANGADTIFGFASISVAVNSFTQLVFSGGVWYRVAGTLSTPTNISAQTIVSVSAAGTYTIQTTDEIIQVDSTANQITLQLPDPSLRRRFIVKDVAGKLSVNQLNLLRFAGENIENLAATKIFTTNFGMWHIYSDGTNYWMSV